MTRASEGLKERWQHRPILGCWCFHPDELTAEAVSAMGYDYVGLDMQHGLIDFQTALRMIRCIDLGDAVPVVRVPANDPALIGQVLDAGALGIIVPMINSPQEASDAVRAARYAPAGERSFGPIRTEIHQGDAYYQTANERIAVLPMIETTRALACAHEIAAVDGVDGLYIGVFDLSLALGLPPGNNDGDPKFDRSLDQVLDACRTSRKIAACHSSPPFSARRLRQGFQMVTASADTIAIQAGLRAHLEAARKGLEPE